MKELRNRIDRIDCEIQKLFEERMEVADEIGKYKAARGVPVFDAAREREKIAGLRAKAGDEESADGIEELFTEIMAISRRHQEKILKEAKMQNKEKNE